MADTDILPMPLPRHALRGVPRYVSATRLVDYKHNPSDVNAGAFIGLSIGAIIYHLHFFPVVHPNCYLPRFHPKANGAIHGQGGRLSSPYLSELEDA